VPTPWTNRDIGSVGSAGSAGYASGTFTVSGSGADIWGSSDAFHYVSQPVSGDVEMTARVTSMQNTHFYAKTGIMLRESLTAGSAHVLINHIPSGIEMIVRGQNGGSTAFIAGTGNAWPTWLRLSRRGSTVTGYFSEDGSSWATLGSTSFSSAGANIGLAVSSHNTSQLNTSLFTDVSVTSGGSTPPPPPPDAGNVVIYASDVPTTALHGAWSRVSDSTSPNGIKLATSNTGYAQTSNPLASPAHYVDVTFNATAGVAYRIWLRLQALNDDKFNDAVWVQFSDARVNGSPVYPINSTSGLLVNLATDSGASSLNRWGWHNGAYWLSQATTVTFPTTGARTLRIQVREDGVQLDQIVLSPSTYLNSAPGPVSNDSTVVPK
jgi:regulation of enolase protein 1 (concanavalin A-like superfamily)